jgi:hypothetical protein
MEMVTPGRFNLPRCVIAHLSNQCHSRSRC